MTIIEYNRLHKYILAGTFKGVIYCWPMVEDGNEDEHKKSND